MDEVMPDCPLHGENPIAPRENMGLDDDQREALNGLKDMALMMLSHVLAMAAEDAVKTFGVPLTVDMVKGMCAYGAGQEVADDRRAKQVYDLLLPKVLERLKLQEEVK
jgi:hypothetical protein